MLKIPSRSPNLQSLQPRSINIERPGPRRRLNLLKLPYVIAHKPTRSEEIAKATAELNERLVDLQTRVAEWKAMKEGQD
ncbi:hypothetical protein KR093_009429 [Drosophila rubida]|uniref:Uncharacterized protein n=1 Tax=Drosophila rubida TaxID=30044 RepID=A0AAD4PM85_9MUSC|nr:hypothetical protein KR093_009429 [Drosophila rubida]